jgi:unsaturated rhamnogalacturonyl hydrolase
MKCCTPTANFCPDGRYEGQIRQQYDWWPAGLRGDGMMQAWSIRMADSTMLRYPLLADEWNYQWGLVLKGFEHLWRITGERKYFDYLRHNIDAFVEPGGAIRGYCLTEYNVDRLNTGKALFVLYEQTGEPKYKKALDLLRSQLDTHPRTASGGFWHKGMYPYQMWLDGIYMADAFYAQYAATFDKNDGNKATHIFDDIAHQIALIDQHTRDEKTGLFYHAWDESKQMPWADPLTGCSPHFWGRAMGWYAMAMVDILDYFPDAHPQRDGLITILNQLVEALEQVQDPRTGVWYQILDRGDRPGNYLESSASCMFVYAMAKGARMKVLPEKWHTAARNGFAGILQQFIRVDGNGQVHLTGTCRSAGLGGDPYRDGSFEYYIGEPVVSDNHHGVGAFLLASTEIELSA